MSAETTTSERPASWGEATVHARPRSRRLLVLGALILVVLLAVVARTVTQDAGHDQHLTSAECHLEQCTGDPGVSGAATTRTEVAARARGWLDDSGIPYSMTEGHAGPGGWGWYRRDCSGFVSMALHLPDDNGGPTTVGLADDVVAVSVDQLRPYDLIGRLGPDSGGENGHVQLFLGWADEQHTKVRVAEQGGLFDPSPWPHEATYAWPERMADGTALRTYRYAQMQD